MHSKVKLNFFFLWIILITVFCSSCYLSRDKHQWPTTEESIERQTLENQKNYAALYKLGVAYATKAKSHRIPSSSWKKSLLHKSVSYLEEAIRVNPESAEANLALGEILGNKKINDGLGAIRHTVISKKLFEKQNNAKGVALAKSNLNILSKKFFSFYLLGYSSIQTLDPSEPSHLVLPIAEKSTLY